MKIISSNHSTKSKYAYYDTLVLPVTKIIESAKLFTEVTLDGISGEVTVLTKHIFDTELEASKFALGRADDRVYVLTRRIKELEGAV